MTLANGFVCAPCPGEPESKDGTVLVSENSATDVVAQIRVADTPPVTELVNAPRSPSEIADEILKLSEAEVSQILLQIGQAQPALLRKANFQLSADPGNDKGTALVAKDPPAVEPRLSTLRYDEGELMFCARQHYVIEAESTTSIDVIRIGKLDQHSSVRWHTYDGTAKAGVKYRASSGLLEFPPGDIYATIKIELIPNHDWDPTTDFYIQLEEETAKNAKLDWSHAFCRVRIVDNDTFPTDKFKKHLKSGGLNEVPSPSLMMEYFKMNWKNPVVRLGSYKCLAADLLENIVYVIGLLLNLILVNNVLTPIVANGEFHVDNDIYLAVVVAGNLFPSFILHYLSYRRNYWKVAGASRKNLQKNLMQAYMSYSSAVRSRLEIGEVMLAITNLTEGLVANTFTQIFPLVKSSVKFLLIMAWQMLNPVIATGTAPTSSVVIMNLVVFSSFPIVILPALKMRRAKTSQSVAAVKAAESCAVTRSLDIMNNYYLIADYMKRHKADDAFQRVIDDINRTTAIHNAVHTNNVFIMKAVTVTVVSAWILIGAILVQQTQIDLAIFLATVSSFTDMGNAWTSIYEILVSMEDSFTLLREITYLLNLPNEEIEFAKAERQTWERTKVMISNLGQHSEGKEFALDTFKIAMDNVSHTFAGETSLKGVSLSLEQGKIHAISTQRGFGKSLILQLLGKRVLLDSADDKGSLFIPVHLKVRHISKEPLFIMGSMYHNLVYGVHQSLDQQSHHDSERKNMNLERVLTICRELGVESKTLARISDKPDAEELHWKALLARSTQHLLNIARGLISNAEVLVIHKPFMDLGPSTRPRVAKILRKFVDQRGLELDPELFYHRRPRTCIISCRPDERLAVQYADELHWPVQRTDESHDDHHLHEADVSHADMFLRKAMTSSDQGLAWQYDLSK